MIETSSGEGDNSSWFNSSSIQPSASAPFIARNTADSLFGYTATDGQESNACYRTVIIPYVWGL